jgi:hypothetical protein
VVAAIVAIAAVIVDNLGLSQYTTEIKLCHNFLHLAYLYDNGTICDNADNNRHEAFTG